MSSTLSSADPSLVKYFPFSSVIDTGFWHLLAHKKLNAIRLDDSAIDIVGHYRTDLSLNLRPLLNVNYESFETYSDASKECHPMYGQLLVTNTYEEFVNKDKKLLINSVAKEIWKDITDGTGAQHPSQSLAKFALLVYADLKKYKFHYWFAFPGLCFPDKTFLTNGSPKVLASVWSENNMNTLYAKYTTGLDADNKTYFIVFMTDSEVSVHALQEYSSLTDRTDGKLYFAFADSCSSDEYPGWPLRNYLALIAVHFKLTECSVLAIRLRERSVKTSLLLDISWPTPASAPTADTIECVGWEKNEKNKLLPRVVDLSALMDPIRLADTAVDLNLKLMRWRLVPSLDLDTICATKCLILGSGTLGCAVGRGLLAWGVRNITFVDNGHVSYSNPVRQSLFAFNDCLDGGRPKAVAAADALKTIFPNVNSRGVQLSIPMPGHPISEQLIENCRKDVELLETLVDEHDVIFLLMDTRESRWLPTVLATVKNKLVINAALGFDTFLVQRHGVRRVDTAAADAESGQPLGAAAAPVSAPTPSSSKMTDHSGGGGCPGRSRKVSGLELGCYYCSDVVAPGNSTRDRTLDQQCTVTRPGVSMLASALAVELMVSVLQHPMRGEAPALIVSGRGDEYTDAVDEDTETALGLVPHQIRGFLSRFQQLMITSERFTKCSACSRAIINAYDDNGFEFLLKAFNDSQYVEQLTGLTDLHNETQLADIWVLSDDSDDGGGAGDEQ